MNLTELTCTILTLLTFFTCNEAIFTAPLPDYLHGLTGYEISGVNGKASKIIKNEVIKTTDNHRVSEPSSRHQLEHQQNDDIVDEERTVYFIEFESEHGDKVEGHGIKSMDNETDSMDTQSPLDPWSIVWYIGSFGGLVAFFLIVSCSEWCCRRSARPLGTPYTAQRQTEPVTITRNITDTPPPPYHLFAPPPYDSVNYNDLVDKTTGEKVDIYVISVPISDTQQTVPD